MDDLGIHPRACQGRNRGVPRTGRPRAGALTLLVLLGLAILAGSLTGCASYLRRRELESVAKDWSLSVRASQVIPVYPLTEDLQPGDVFLVQTTVQEQAAQYSRRGFLSLDQLLTRLNDVDYTHFYRDAYWKGDYAGTPHLRPQPQVDAEPPKPDSNPGTGETPERGKGTRFPDARVPRAAFPSYDFSVRSGAGLKIAVPVQGVPLGLALMGASSATGTITISDAFTYGADEESLLRLLNDWAIDDVREELASIAETTKTQLYLRVISRVYLAGAVVVSLQNQATGSVGVDAGAPKDVSVLDLGEDQANKLKTIADSYREALSALSGALNSGLPGGSIRLAAASRGSVVLREDFDRPIAFGYLGFDVPVRKNGSLGPPVATRDVLERGVVEAEVGSAGSRLRGVTFAHLRSAHYRLQKLATDATDPQVKAKASDFVRTLDSLQWLAPDTYPVPIYQRDQTNLSEFHAKGEKVGGQGFAKVTTYLSNLNENIREVDAVLALPDGKLDGRPIDAATRKSLLKVREETARELETLTTKLKANRDLSEAMAFAGSVQ